MKNKHIYVLIIFLVLTIVIAGAWKGIEQININKYNLTEEKIAKYQEQIKNMVSNPSEILVEEMTESYKEAAQKEYENRISNQMPVIQIVLISIAISGLVCAIIEFLLYKKLLPFYK